MTVKYLIELLADVPDDMDVLIPMGAEFDGYFKSPCMEETGVAELGIEEDSDETRKSFCIVPCGFFLQHEGVPPELN